VSALAQRGLAFLRRDNISGQEMSFRGLLQCSSGLVLAATSFALVICHAQTEGIATFGSTVVIPGGLTGKIYFIKPSSSLPKFEKLEPIGTIYAKGLYIPPREFTEGFPGITDRVEWFAIDFTGRFYVERPGSYRFNLASDDGSKLYIDHKLVIDNDGVHPTLLMQNVVKLSGGVHAIRLSYFQGPRYQLSLMLAVAGPGDRHFRPFNTDEFKPPPNPDDWKYGSPDDWKELQDPNTGRRKLKDVVPSSTGEFISVPTQVLSHGKPVRDLRQTDFLVRDNDELKDIAGFGFADQSLDIILLFDASGGMRPFNARVKDVAPKAMSRLGPRDRVGVIVAGEKLSLALGLSSDRRMVAAAIRKIQPGASGAELNASIVLTARYLREKARPEAARAIVILTLNDGRREIPDRATRDELWLSNVTLSGLLAKNRAETESPGAADVRPFIEATGGAMLNMDSKNIPLAEILKSLHDRYLIAYRAPDGPPKTIHRISVGLTPEARARLQDIEIKARGGYVIAAR
jgi:VWFA-related protein